MPRLLQAYELSRRLAVVPRILTWDLAMTNATAADRDASADFIVALLRELLETLQMDEAAPGTDARA